MNSSAASLERGWGASDAGAAAGALHEGAAAATLDEKAEASESKWDAAIIKQLTDLGFESKAVLQVFLWPPFSMKSLYATGEARKRLSASGMQQKKDRLRCLAALGSDCKDAVQVCFGKLR